MENPFRTRGLLEIAKKLEFTDEQKQELEKRVNTISRNSFLSIGRDVSFKWSHVVKDNNRIHLFNSSAQEYGFQETLVHGTYLASHKEQYILDILNVINFIDKTRDNKKKFVYFSESIEEFLRPLYHGKATKWDCDDVREIENDLVLEFSAVNEKGKYIIKKSLSKIGLERKSLDGADMEPFLKNLIIAEREDKIEEDHLMLYYECLSRAPQGVVPMMFPAAFIPSVLLDICSKETGRPEGAYKSIDLNFHNLPNINGKFTTRIIMPSQPVKTKRFYKYTFKTLCMQEKIPILSGEIVCQSLREINLK